MELSDIESIMEEIKELIFRPLLIISLFASMVVLVSFISFFIWAMFIPSQIQSNIGFSSFATFVTGAASLTLVVMVYAQVRKEAEYLENFEPNLQLFERDPNGTTISKEDVKDEETIDGWFVAFNPSQTATIINEARIKEAPETRVRVHGLDLEQAEKVRNEQDYSNNVPIKDNDGILFKFRISGKEWDAKHEEIDQILGQEYMTIVLQGEFGEEEYRIDVT